MGLHFGELTDASTDCSNVELLALLHVCLNGGEGGGACVGVHDSPEGLEGAHHGRFRVRHFLLSLCMIENGLNDDQGARAQCGEEGADGDGPEEKTLWWVIERQLCFVVQLTKSPWGFPSTSRE